MGQVVLVTGAGQGLGAAIAAGFAAQGDQVIATDIDPSAAMATARAIGGTGLAMNVAESASVAACAAAVAERHGAVDVLVNNAGIVGRGGLLVDLDPAVLDAALAVNLRGTLLVTQTFARQMIAAKRGGAIVTVSSAGARQPTAGLGHYEATKAAVEALMRSAALELAPHGIRANCVAPGPVRTPMTRGMTENAQALGAWVARIPLGRIADTGHVVPAVLFLASPAAAHITGTSLPVDGGQLLT